MKSPNFPVKNLIRLNYLMAAISFSMVFTVLFIFRDIVVLKEVIFYSIFVFISLSLKGSINLGVLLFLEKRYDIRSSIFRKLRYFLSFALNAIVDGVFFIGIALINERLLNVLFLLNLTLLILVINFVIITVQDYFIIFHFKNKADIEFSRLKSAQSEAANQLLRQQIHPHFLFNALNTLKSLYKINPQAGEEYLIRLSDFLRVSVSSHNLKKIPLKDEIKLCVDYLEMQKIRFGESLSYKISVDDEKTENGFVPSFSIQPLLENAIKHNELTRESPLTITIRNDGDRIKVTNNLQLKSTSETSTGSGLSNLSERYRIISNDELIIENDGKTFSVSIKILSNENSNN
jgi:sensor histidine kinase YesM